jgi:catechol 2,3-dioxygenase-like lactoylglutathione lyase family enzyme
MKIKSSATFAVLAIVCWAIPAFGQLVASHTARIASGQQHLYVSSVEAHKRFWIDTLGGTPAKVGTIIKFENVLIVLTPRASGLGTKGSVVDHISFQVPNISAILEKLKANGFPIITRAELPSTVSVTDGIGFLPDENARIAFTMAPDDVKIEFVENPGLAVPLSMHHVHFATPDVPNMLAWYVTTLGAKRRDDLSAELPGVRLVFSSVSHPVMPTKGRVHDHIGFEVKDLGRFCQELEARGITFDRPYTKIPAQNAASAFLIDPWGTQIELSEGMAAF